MIVVGPLGFCVVVVVVEVSELVVEWVVFVPYATIEFHKTIIPIERLELLHIVRAKLEGERLQIGQNVSLLNGLRNDNDAALQLIPDQDVGRWSLVLFGQRLDELVLNQVGLLGVWVEAAGRTQGTVGSQFDGVRATKLQQFRLTQIWVTLDLVDRKVDRSVGFDFFFFF